MSTTCSVCNITTKSSRSHNKSKKHTRNLISKARAVFQDTNLDESSRRQLKLDIARHFWNLPLSQFKTIDNEVAELIELLK